ncbi:histone H1.1-like [Amblyraja radiata]|uniref:histone H1.1-like n=1 Tax=Amblyraja radiata TaxID=386614 RepID=UPI0014038C90|nr:histone H1.1-like [Amblyraja radiata]
MAENQKLEFPGDSGGRGGGGADGGGGGSDTIPPQARPAPDKGAAVKKKGRPRKQQQVQPKRVKLPKKAPVGPTVTERVLSVAASSMERRGISLVALKKALSAMGYDVSHNNSRVNRTVRQLVQRGSLVRTSGTGASGSFRFNRTAAPKREKAGVARRMVASKREKKVAAALRKPTTAPSKRSATRRTKHQSRTADRPFKRRPRTVGRPHAKARSRLQPRGDGPRATRVYRKHQSVRSRKAARGRIQRKVVRPRKIRTQGLVEGTILAC